MQTFYVCVFWLLSSIACRHQPRQQRNGKLIITLLKGLKPKTRDYNNSKCDINDMPFHLSLSLNSGWRDAVKGVLLCLCTLQQSQYVEGIMAFFGYYSRFLLNQINRTNTDSITFGGKGVLLGHVDEHSILARLALSSVSAMTLPHEFHSAVYSALQLDHILGYMFY